jgi:L,D-peptidoglycan transpeptidase YkuD (ErfK/YbiS/YcfS/YnhG family)
MKREGDGATPIGTFAACQAFYRPDKQLRPLSGLPVRPLRKSDGWCDSVNDRNYNRMVSHPYPASAERMWRDDWLYDLVVVLDHNRRPRVRGLGSAIFMHVAPPGYAPTAGCIAVSAPHLRRILGHMKAGTKIRIGA